MHIVVDANILFAALIKDSTVRKIILNSKTTFLVPEQIIREYENHMLEIQEKSGLSSEEFNALMKMLLQKCTVIKEESILPYREKAQSLIAARDPDDVPFIACALANPGSAIWSDDLDMCSQTEIRVIKTREMIQIDENQS